jgi:hypothetical protein
MYLFGRLGFDRSVALGRPISYRSWRDGFHRNAASDCSKPSHLLAGCRISAFIYLLFFLLILGILTDYE